MQQRYLLEQAAVAAASAARRCWCEGGCRDSKTLPCSGRRSFTAATLAFGAGPIWAANAAQKPCVLFGLALLHSSNACVWRSAGTFFFVSRTRAQQDAKSGCDCNQTARRLQRFSGVRPLERAWWRVAVAVHPQPGATVPAAANEQRPNDATTVRGRATFSFARTTHCECCIASNLAISRQHVCRGLPPCGTAAARRRESDGQRRQRRDDGAGYRWLLGANCALQKTWQRLWQVDAVLFCQRQQAHCRRRRRRRQCAKTEV